MIYDYAIIGTGAAGLHLALAMNSDPFFSDKSILLIDKSQKITNDKTWCFWEKEAGLWDDIIYRKWQHAYFKAKTSLHLDLAPYTYKMLRAIDFYDHARSAFSKKENIHWVEADVTELEENEWVRIITDPAQYEALHVFDSRIDEAFHTAHGHHKIWQHFKGWLVKTPQPTFDPQSFTMMDFSVKWKDSTSFTYILPLSEDEALVEFTLFTPYVIEDIGYDAMLNKYLEEVLKVEGYQVNAVEKGIIPMTDYPFHEKSTKHITKIGTAGSWVKPSSGYSFKNAEKYSALIVNQLKSEKPIPHVMSPAKFRFYDKVFLDVLTHENDLGETLFNAMYQKNKTSKIFKFLDERTSLLEDIRIISSFPTMPFLKALMRTLR